MKFVCIFPVEMGSQYAGVQVKQPRLTSSPSITPVSSGLAQIMAFSTDYSKYLLVNPRYFSISQSINNIISLLALHVNCWDTSESTKMPFWKMVSVLFILLFWLSISYIILSFPLCGYIQRWAQLTKRLISLIVILLT